MDTEVQIMQHDFWHDKWQNNNIGFHQDQPHALLTQYFRSLDLKLNTRIILPNGSNLSSTNKLLGKILNKEN